MFSANQDLAVILGRPDVHSDILFWTYFLDSWFPDSWISSFPDSQSGGQDLHPRILVLEAGVEKVRNWISGGCGVYTRLVTQFQGGQPCQRGYKGSLRRIWSLGAVGGGSGWDLRVRPAAAESPEKMS